MWITTEVNGWNIPELAQIMKKDLSTSTPKFRTAASSFIFMWLKILWLTIIHKSGLFKLEALYMMTLRCWSRKQERSSPHSSHALCERRLAKPMFKLTPELQGTGWLTIHWTWLPIPLVKGCNSCQFIRSSVACTASWTLWKAKDEAVGKVCFLLAKNQPGVWTNRSTVYCLCWVPEPACQTCHSCLDATRVTLEQVTLRPWH